MHVFAIPCRDCSKKAGKPEYKPFTGKEVLRNPADPDGSRADDWSVLFVCPDCGLVSLYAKHEIKEFSDVPLEKKPFLYAESFVCGFEGCISQVKVYACTVSSISAGVTTRTIAQQGASGDDKISMVWHFDESVRCGNHQPLIPRKRDVEWSSVLS